MKKAESGMALWWPAPGQEATGGSLRTFSSTSALCGWLSTGTGTREVWGLLLGGLPRPPGHLLWAVLLGLHPMLRGVLLLVARLGVMARGHKPSFCGHGCAALRSSLVNVYASVMGRVVLQG